MNQNVLWVYYDMKYRCTRPDHRHYKNYGGRGITVCERWLQSSKNFVEDMGPRPEGGMLERKDNSKGYSPENCIWATRKEQNSNRRNCIYVFIGEERVTLKEYCRRKELLYRPIAKRIKRGWTLALAVSIPVGKGTRYASVRRNSAIA